MKREIADFVEDIVNVMNKATSLSRSSLERHGRLGYSAVLHALPLSGSLNSGHVAMFYSTQIQPNGWTSYVRKTLDEKLP